uniref:Flavin-containing monooxygenase n=1 Tax=Amphilophus citrinellus TaxID=61819 RepID=A0A3Q0R4D3_AMPCI
VVGAGAAGLCAARHVLSRPGCFAPPVVFELSDSVGGTWCYDERVGTYDSGRPVHSSMYRDLTNLPKEVMMFPDFPFDPQLSSFLPHQEVQRYLERYCQSHGIRPHIRFNTTVESVKPIVVTAEGEEERTAWEVTSSDLSGRQKTETFDSVFVCSTVLHSHSYRFAEPFSGQSVVVLGAKASGLDISIELAKVGAQRFQDGSVTEADVLMFCTGYNFRFPFLDAAQLGLEIQDHMISPLYRFMVPPAFPSLFFIGICKIICPFPNFNCQVQFALAVLAGSVTLPTRAQMEDEVRRELQVKLERGVQHRHLLILDQDQWEYCNMLSRSAGFSPLPPVIRSLFEEVHQQRQIHPENYRKLNYRLISDTQWE